VIFDTRSHRYRGGSRWLGAGVLGVYVGLTVTVAPPIDPAALIICVHAEDRTMTVAAEDRTVAIDAEDRTLVVPTERVPC
jgi:hypothetical protein